MSIVIPGPAPRSLATPRSTAPRIKSTRRTILAVVRGLRGSHLAFSQILVSTSRMDAANHLLPLAVGMPRSLRAPAIARSDVAPLAQLRHLRWP